MKSNYNDIVDIILTLIEDGEVASSIAISGSIVPYLATNKESGEFHSDFYVLVKDKKINYVRKQVMNLSKEYSFDVVSDSTKECNSDFGFKMRYEQTFVGFFPYSLIDDALTIKTYSVDKENSCIKLKTKIIPDIAKSSVIRQIKFGKDKKIRIMSPEFILAEKESKEKEPGNPTKETMRLLEKISDESVLKVVRRSVLKTKINIESKDIKTNNKILGIILSIGIIALIVIAYACFKK